MSKKHLEQLKKQNKPRSMEELLDLSIESLAKEVQSLEYQNTLLNSSIDLYSNSSDRRTNKIQQIKDYLEIETNKNNTKYMETGNIEYYYKWLALVGFKEGMEEILKEKL